MNKQNVAIFVLAILFCMSLISVYGLLTDLDKAKKDIKRLDILTNMYKESADLNIEYVKVVEALIEGTERTDGENIMSPTQITSVARVIMEQSRMYRDDGVTPSLIMAIIKRESNFNPEAISEVGARGLMQVMRETAGPHLQDMELMWSNDILYDPVVNVRVGTRELVRLHRIYMSEGLESREDFRFSLTSFFWGARNTRMLYSTEGRVDNVPSLEYSIGVLKHRDNYVENGLL